MKKSLLLGLMTGLILNILFNIIWNSNLITPEIKPYKFSAGLCFFSLTMAIGLFLYKKILPDNR